MKPFHLLKHACDNHGVDEWEEEISKVLKSYSKEDVYATIRWLVDNMELYDRDGDGPVSAKDVFTMDDCRSVRSLYYGVIRGCVCCGATREHDRLSKCDVAMNAAEFAFIYMHPGYNSYLSFYLPIDNVINYMKKYNEKLEQETERIYNENRR